MDEQEKRKEAIAGLCDKAGCNENVRKTHFQQYVHRRWNPHPSEAFVKWWSKHRDFREGVGVVTARNCHRYYDEFLEAKKFGIENEPTSAFQKVKSAMEAK